MVVFTRSQTRSQTRSETICTVVAGDDKQCTRPYEKEFYEYSETSLRICSEHLKHMDELRQDRKSLETVTLNNTGPLTDDKIAIIKAYLIQKAASSSSSPDAPDTHVRPDIPPNNLHKKRRAETNLLPDQLLSKQLEDAKLEVKKLQEHFSNYSKNLNDNAQMVFRGSARKIIMLKEKIKQLNTKIHDANLHNDESIQAKLIIKNLEAKIEGLEKSRSKVPEAPRIMTPTERESFTQSICEVDDDIEELTENNYAAQLALMLDKLNI